jgi:hypothetical protein
MSKKIGTNQERKIGGGGGDKKPNQRKCNKTLSQKNQKGTEKNLIKRQ